MLKIFLLFSLFFACKKDTNNNENNRLLSETETETETATAPVTAPSDSQAPPLPAEATPKDVEAPGSEGEDDSNTSDSDTSDSNVADSNIVDTSVADSNVADSNIVDTSVADSNEADSNVADSNVNDVNDFPYWFEEDILYEGATPIGTYSKDSFKSCGDFCAADSSCKVWTWDSDTKDCTIYPNGGARSPDIGTYSGSFDSTPYESYIYQMAYDTHLTGGTYDESEPNIVSALDCAEICEDDSSCVYWVWGTTDGNKPHRCWQKSEDAWQNRDETTEGRISGSKAIEASDLLSDDCWYEEDIDYQGDLIGDTNVIQGIKSLDLCCGYCQADDECYAWVWSREKQKCWLKAAGGARRALSSHMGVYSGSKDLIPHKAYSCRMVDDYDYAGNDFTSTSSNPNPITGTNSPDDCCDACTDNANCYYWTWDSSNNDCWLKDATALEGFAPLDSVISGSRVVTGVRGP